MRWPVLPTLFVALAIPVLIGLGVWQLDRREEKAELLARIEAASQRPPAYLNDFGWPIRNVHLIRIVVDCRFDARPGAVTGGSGADGRGGFAYAFLCFDGSRNTGRRLAWVNGGISSDPNLQIRPPDGVVRVTGVLLDLGLDSIVGDPIPQFRVIADRPLLPQLRPAYQPTAASIPDNHLLYALQWFAFAGALAVIYALWIRRWRRERRAAA